MTTRAQKSRAGKRRVRAWRSFAQMPLKLERQIFPRDRYTPLGKISGGRTVKLGYRSADYSRDDAVLNAADGNEAANLRYDRYDLIKRSRQLYRDAAVYRAIVDRAVDFIVGKNGFQLQARTGSKRMNALLEFLWQREFSRYPEVRGQFDFYRLQRAVCLQTILDGDVGALKVFTPYGGRLQLIDAMRIGGYYSTTTDGLDSGVRLDKYGRPTAFKIYDYSEYGYLQGEGREVPASNMIFVANLEFLSNVRGAPILVSAFPLIEILDDVLQSEAKAWQVLSRFALSVERDSAPDIADALADDDPKDLESPSLTTKVQELEQAIIFHTNPGGKVRGIDRNLPGVQLEPATRLFIRLIALPLGMPFELAVLDWSKSNYSSSRASLEVAFQNFSRWQHLLKGSFLRRAYRWKVRDWIARGLVQARPDILEHEWIAPEFPWIDQLKETQAWGERIDRGLATWGQAVRATGRDPGDLRLERAAEIRAAIEEANRLNADYPGANVDWRTLVGLEPRSTGGPVPETEVEKGESKE